MTFHLNQALGVGTQTKTKGGEGWGNSQVQLHAQQLCAHSSCVHTAWCVYLQHLTDSIIMGSAIISSHQSNIKAITCVSAFSVVIKANSTVIYLRCVNIPAFSPSLVPHMLLASHHWKNCTTVLQQGGCMCVWGGVLSYFNEAHKTFEIASSLHSVHMNHCSVVTLPVEQETERDTKEERKWV